MLFFLGKEDFCYIEPTLTGYDGHKMSDDARLYLEKRCEEGFMDYNAAMSAFYSNPVSLRLRNGNTLTLEWHYKPCFFEDGVDDGLVFAFCIRFTCLEKDTDYSFGGYYMNDAIDVTAHITIDYLFAKKILRRMRMKARELYKEEKNTAFVDIFDKEQYRQFRAYIGRLKRNKKALG